MSEFRYLLDTNIVSDLICDPGGVVAARIAQVGEETVCISLVVAAELRFDAATTGGLHVNLQNVSRNDATAQRRDGFFKTLSF
jgi:predicted nucleic acid-binding protein